MATTLKDKVALVTGGNSGIGASVVALFLEHGAKVAALDISELDTPGPESLVRYKCNVASEKEVDEVFAKVIEKWGQLDVLVNCAGVMDAFSRTADITNQIWERCFAVNVTGPMYLMRRCIPQFLKQDTKGAIVNICSTAAARGAAAGAAYTASKHALLGLSKNTSWMYGKDGIRTNAVLPGGVRTNIMANSNVNIDREAEKMLFPYMGCMPGLCDPEEIANAVLFLATAPSVNGAEVAVDRGWLTS